MDLNGDTYENGWWMKLTQDFVQWRISVLVTLRRFVLLLEYSTDTPNPIQLFYSVDTAQSGCVL